jgi:hypothetical protein
MTKKRRPVKTAEQRRLEAEHLETRLRESTCRKCLSPILVGTVWGEPKKIDRTFINTDGEIAAIYAGVRTYGRVYGGRVIERRGSHIREGMPRRGRIMAEHRCGHRWPATHFDVREIWSTWKGQGCPPF